MSLARPIQAGASWRISMRCVERKFFLNPTTVVTNAIGFCLAIACARYGVLLHAVSAMSNHLHLDVTDPFGVVDDFRRDFKSLLARALNCHYSRWEYFWAPVDGMQEVETREAAIIGMAYTITNPVAAGLVAGPKAWPGLCTTPAQLGADVVSVTYHKPDFFFRHEEDGGLPETATLRLVPHCLASDVEGDEAEFAAFDELDEDGEDDEFGQPDENDEPNEAETETKAETERDRERRQQREAFARAVTKRVNRLVTAKRKELDAAGRDFATAAAVSSRNWWDCPRTTADRRRLNPRFAEPDTERRVQRLTDYVEWQAEYGGSRGQWLTTGTAVFPPGTHQMRNLPGVTIRDG